MADTEGGGQLMVLCSQDEAAEWLAASALQLFLVDVEPDECARLLVGGGTLAGLAPHERAAVAAHRRTLAWADAQGYTGIAEQTMEGITSTLGLEDGVCDWQQLFDVFPDPWFADDNSFTTSTPAETAVRLRIVG